MSKPWPGYDVFTPPRSKGRKSAWNYTHQFSEKDQVQIHSRAQFERECAKRNLEHVTRDDLLHNGAAPKRAKPSITHEDKNLIESTVSDLLPRAKALQTQGAFKDGA